MDVFDFILITLATGAVVDVWFNGSIFADWRAYLQARLDREDFDAADTAIDDPDGIDFEDGGEELPFMMRTADKVIPDFIVELLSCPFCFSYHVPWIGLVLFYLIPMMFSLSPGWVFLWHLPVYSLAATRLSNLVNGLLPKELKYENDSKTDNADNADDSDSNSGT